MPPQAAPFWLCYQCGAQMRPITVDGVPRCASCNSDFLEILDEDVNPDPTHELPHPPTRPGEEGTYAAPPPIPPRPNDGGGGFLGALFDTLIGNLGQAPGGPPAVPPRPTETGSRSGPSTRTFAFGNGSFTIMTGAGVPQRGDAAGEDGLDAYFRGFGARPPGPPPNVRPEEASGAALLQALLSMIAEDTGAQFVPGGRLGDYAMSEQGYNDILERLMAMAGPQGAIPASEATITGLPRTTFDETSLKLCQFKDCSVCLTDFEVGDTVVTLSCKHVFHEDCLVPWLESNGSCPICRHSLVTPDEPPRAAGTSTTQSRDGSESGDDYRSPLATAGDFLTNTFTSTLHRLFGQSGTQNPSASGIATPAEPSVGTPARHSASTSQDITDATDNYQRTAREHSDGPSSDDARLEELMENLETASENVRRAEAMDEDPPEADLSASDPPDMPVHSGGFTSSFSSAIPSDYRARHARREREQHEQEERERQQRSSSTNPAYWDDVD